jgi:hypothetical protein
MTRLIHPTNDARLAEMAKRKTDITRVIANLRSMLREAEQAALPCGVRPPNPQAARAKLHQVARELEGVLQ